MQEPNTPQTNYTPRPAPSTHGSAASFLLHLPEARAKYLPASPRVVVRLVVAWLVLFVVLNAVATNMADKPNLSQASPVPASQMRQQLSLDEERRANIESLQVYLDKHYERFAVYPSISQINSVEFRKADPAFKVANRRTFMDPLATSATLATQPTKNTYFYVPTPAGCSNSSNFLCTGYTMGATMENGQLYIKHNSH